VIRPASRRGCVGYRHATRAGDNEGDEVRTILANRLRPSPALLVAIVALAVALGGVAYAAIPDSAGVIHGCYSRTGALSVINTSAGQTCGRGTTALNWNQTGPQGQPGLSNLSYTTYTETWTGPGYGAVTMGCPQQNGMPLSGGFSATDPQAFLTDSYPGADHARWAFSAYAPDSGSTTGTFYLICAVPSSVWGG
jgi:hypothetical protein